MAETNPTSSPELKQCSTCKEWKPLTDFYFDKRRSQPRHQCKKCGYKSNKATTLAWQERKAATRQPPIMFGQYRQLPDLPPDIQKRIWNMVDQRGPDECWPWKGDTFDHGGYGKFSIDGIKWRVPRLIWKMVTGEDPREKLIRHEVCENPPCCNFAHLSTGYQKENAEDAIKHGRYTSGADSFPSQHPERMPRGDDHWTRRHPEKVKRGETHYQNLRRKN